tara:strand:- start:424 stop:690 length:267 start_codon:yes stop_codon:yes gene_type:complete
MKTLKKENMNLQEQLMKMPELEEKQLIHKRMNNINTFQCAEGEVFLRGTDEYGQDFQICFDAYDFIDWIDNDKVEYIKEKLIKHIKTK